MQPTIEELPEDMADDADPPEPETVFMSSGSSSGNGGIPLADGEERRLSCNTLTSLTSSTGTEDRHQSCSSSQSSVGSSPVSPASETQDKVAGNRDAAADRSPPSTSAGPVKAPARRMLTLGLSRPNWRTQAELEKMKMGRMHRRPSMVEDWEPIELPTTFSKQDLRPKGYDKLVIHPDNRAKGAWEVFIIFCVLYTAVVEPLKVTYLVGVLPAFDDFLDIVFAADIVFQCFCGFHDAGGKRFPVLSFRVILLNYLRTWFVIDLVAAIPFDRFYSTVREWPRAGARTRPRRYLPASWS
jgi:hypothetical protein